MASDDDAEPIEYARGQHPNSRAQLRARKTGSRRPTREKFRKTTLDKLRKQGWTGNEETVDFDLFCTCRYDLEFVAKGGAERSRLRHDLLELSDRLGLGAKAKPTRAPQVIPNRSPEHLAKVARLLSRIGAWGPEAQRMALLGDEVDSAFTETKTHQPDERP